MKRALFGLLLVLAGPLSLIPFLDVAWVRQTGAPAFAAQAAGVWLAVGAARRARGRRGVAAVAVAAVLLTLVFAYLWWFGSRLPKADRFAALPAAPAIEARDVDDAPRSLAAATKDAPLLLVFFRGRW
jgi:hypothetical protein